MIAITGGKGFVGKALVEKLSDNNDVISIVRGNSIKDYRNYQEVGSKHPKLKEILKDVTVFINTAGKVSRNQSDLKRANIDTIREFLDLLPAHLPQIIHLSSANVFFAKHNQYGQSKKDGEQIWIHSSFADRLLTLRPTWIYGPGDTHNSYPLIKTIEHYPILPLPNKPVRPVYIHDFVDLIANLCQQENLGSQTWTVSGDQITSFFEITGILSKQIGKKNLLIPFPTLGLRLSYRLSKMFKLQNISERIFGFQISKIWHDASVWEFLPRKLTPLAIGLQQTLVEYQALNP